MMKILLVTPLYPPDIAEPAPYAKELARRLCVDHDVIIATYGDLPEPIPGVTIRTVSKHSPLLIRLMRFIILLWRESLRADVLYVQNGPSVELPTFIVQFFSRTPYFIRMTDTRARDFAEKHTFIKYIEGQVVQSAQSEIIPPTVPDPLPRPEVLPLEPFPLKEMHAWEHSWNAHTLALVHIFSHENK